MKLLIEKICLTGCAITISMKHFEWSVMIENADKTEYQFAEEDDLKTVLNLALQIAYEMEE